MGSSITTLLFDILAKDNASKVFAGLGKTVGESGGSLDKWKMAGTAALVAVGTATAAFAKSSVDKFREVGTEVTTLQRIMGGTAEEASRIRFAATQTGIGMETLTKSLTIFSKNLAKADDAQDKSNAAMQRSLAADSQKLASLEKLASPTQAQIEQMDELRDKVGLLTAATRAQDGSLAVLGVTVQNAAGQYLPMSQILPDLAEKFAAMPNGVEKTALATKLFGRSGAELLPFLNKGREGIAALAAESDRFGMTLSGPQLAALKANKVAQREWDAAIDGVRVQFGAQLLPVLTTGATFLTGTLIPAITSFTGFLQENPAVAKAAAVALGILAVGVWAVNSALLANPITWVVVAIAAFVGAIVLAYQKVDWFRAIVDTAFHVIGTTVSWLWENVAKPAWEGFKVALWAVGQAGIWLWNNALQPAFSWIVGGVAWLLGSWSSMLRGLSNVPGFDWAKDAADNMQGAADKATALKDGIKKIDDLPDPRVQVTLDAYLTPAYISAMQTIGQNKLQAMIAARAGGGPIIAGTPYLVGEDGPELITPDRDGYVHPADETARMLAGSGRPLSLAPPPASAVSAAPNILVRVYVGGKQLLDDMRVVAEQVNDVQARTVSDGVW